MLTEALAFGVPILATRIDGATGLLGDDHPGLFEVGDASGLAALIQRCEEQPSFLEELAQRSRERAWIADPERELESWKKMLAELFPGVAELLPKKMET